MKLWEDIIREKLSAFRGAPTPSQDQALWNSIEGMLPPPARWAWWSDVRVWMGVGVAAVLALTVTPWSVEEDVDPQFPLVEEEALDAGKATNGRGESALALDAEASPVTQPSVALDSDVSETPEALPSVSDPTEIAVGDLASVPAPPVADDGKLTDSGALSAQTTAPTTPNALVTTTAFVAENARQQNGTAGEGGAPPTFNVGFEGSDSNGRVSRSASNGLDVEHGALAVQPMRSRFAWLGLSPMGSPALLDMPVFDSSPYRPDFAVRVYGGATLSRFRFSDEALDAYSENFVADYSAAGGVSLEFSRWGQQWSVGLNMSDYVHRLEFQETTEEPWWTEGVQSIEINAITGDTVAVNVGPVLGTEIQHRSVHHHGRYSVIAVPLEWRTQRVKGRWHFGLGLGALLHIRRNAAGSVVTEEGIVERYADGDMSKSRLSWMPTARAYLGMQFAPTWRVDLSVLAGQQRYRSRKSAVQSGSALPGWDGQLLNGQFQVGISRYFSRSGR